MSSDFSKSLNVVGPTTPAADQFREYLFEKSQLTPWQEDVKSYNNSPDYPTQRDEIIEGNKLHSTEQLKYYDKLKQLTPMMESPQEIKQHRKNMREREEELIRLGVFYKA